MKKHTGIRIFFLVLFLGYFADISFFNHTHIIQGVTVVHSHYFRDFATSKGSSQPARHQHTPHALSFIHSVNTWLALVPPLPEINQTLPLSRVPFIEEEVFFIIPSCPSSFYLRGPPTKA